MYTFTYTYIHKRSDKGAHLPESLRRGAATGVVSVSNHVQSEIQSGAGFPLLVTAAACPTFGGVKSTSLQQHMVFIVFYSEHLFHQVSFTSAHIFM